MVSSRLAVASVVLIFGVVASSSSQTTPEKAAATASISGKIRVKDKAVAGVVVFAEDQNAGRRWTKIPRATTDSTGSYRITNVPAGTYVIRPVAPAFALDEDINSVVISEGENVEDIDISMVPGGVITGKITDADGKPLIEENVNVLQNYTTSITVRNDSLRTDDRGIYRAYGLRPGKYIVYVGQNDSLPHGARPSYGQTFYPSVTDMAKATDIEVREGSETKNIDIVVGRPPTTYNVSGRVLDAETGKPLSRIKYGVYRSQGEYGGSSVVGETFTNANGEFRVENVLPGKYSVFLVPEDSGVRGDSVAFEVIDHDVADLVIRAGKAATISGVVVVEGAENAKPGIKASGLYVNAWVEGAEDRFTGSHSQLVKPDGSFRISDIQKGLNNFTLYSPTRSEVRPLQLVRIERDGVVQPRGLIVRDGEQVTGVRLVAKYLTGAIHGQVKVEGELLPGSHMVVWITYLDENGTPDQFGMGNSQPQLDSRRRFTAQGLAAGTYQVNVTVFEQGRQDSTSIFKQQVTVLDNAVSEVTITVKAKP
jgi:hypothetical protein